MPYSTPDDIRAIIHTTLTDTEITELITQSDAEIDKRIGAQSTEPLITKLSALITARTIRHRQPTSTTIGEYRQETTDDLSAEINSIFKLYQPSHIKSSSYQAKEETL